MSSLTGGRSITLRQGRPDCPICHGGQGQNVVVEFCDGIGDGSQKKLYGCVRWNSERPSSVFDIASTTCAVGCAGTHFAIALFGPILYSPRHLSFW